MSRKKKLLIGGGVLLLLAPIVAFSIKYNRTETTAVQTGRVERKELLESKVNASGEIRAKEFVNIQAEVPGIIIELNVREGDRIQKGQVLLRLDPTQQRADADMASGQMMASQAESENQKIQIANSENNHERDKASLLTARADLERAKVDNIRSKGTYQRKQQLHEDNLVSREEYELAKAEYQATQSSIEAARARVSQAEIQIKTSALQIEQTKTMHQASLSRFTAARATRERAQDLFRKTTLASPLTGIVTKLNMEKGERAIPGIQSDPRATIMTIADMSVVQVELKVDETDVVGISLRDKAKVKVDALPERVIDGEVIEIGNSPITRATSGLGGSSQEAKDFKVLIQLIDPLKELRPGLSATTDITTRSKTGVLAAPLQAITVREVPIDAQGNYVPPDPAELKKKFEKKSAFSFGQPKPDSVAANKDRDKKAKKKEMEGVFVLTKENTVRFRPVKTGIKGETEIEIVGGLSDGDEIVTGSYKTLRTIEDGTPVKIDNTALKSDQEKKDK